MTQIGVIPVYKARLKPIKIGSRAEMTLVLFISFGQVKGIIELVKIATAFSRDIWT